MEPALYSGDWVCFWEHNKQTFETLKVQVKSLAEENEFINVFCLRRILKQFLNR